MNHCTLIATALLSGTLLLGGCTAAPQMNEAEFALADFLAPQPIDDTIALAAIGQTIDSNRNVPATFHLGAGDALGQAVFISYVAYCRANGRPDMHYATGGNAVDTY